VEQPTIEFQVKGQGGEPQSVTDQQIFQQLAQGGFAPLSISPDGQTVTMQDQQGEYALPLSTVLQNLGMGEVVGGKPLDADYDNVEPGWRALVHKLPDDTQRREVLTQVLAQRGIQNPQLMGSGRDWHVFNPNNNSWMALTNNPEWDSSDLVEAGLEIPRFLASGAGGAAAGAATGGNPFAAMAGAAGGGGLVDAMERGAMAYFSPEYRDVVSKNAGGNVADLAKNMAYDAAGAGVAKLGGAALSAVTKGGAQAVNPVSTAMRGAGAVGRVGGELVHGAANAIDGPMGREVATSFVPGLAEAQGVGLLAEAPAWLARKGAGAIGAAGESQFLTKNFPGAADALSGFSERLLRSRAGGAPTLAQRIAGNTGGTAHGSSAANVVGNAAEGATSRVRQMMGHGAPQEEMRERLVDAYKEARRYGIDPRQARNIGRQSAQDYQGRFMRATDPVTQRAGQLGQKAGQYMDLAEEGGRKLGRSAAAVTGVGIKGVKNLGGLARGAGEGVEALGTLARPIEEQAYGTLASRAALESPFAFAEEQWAPWRQKPRKATMQSTLAGGH
jgi:hypothetical protein